MADPTRPLPNLVPEPDGSWTGRTVLTPTSFTTRGLFTLPPSKVIPVIVVPGTMGSNLRAATSPALHANEVLSPGDPAWRAPNTTFDGIKTARKWKAMTPKTRQLMLDVGTLQVDSRGDILLPPEARNYGMTEGEVRKRGWGEVHWDSYGKLLYGLHVGLNHTFEMDSSDNVRVICRHWKDVMECDPAQWGVRSIDRLTEPELEKHAGYYYPVYAFGYNWVASCEKSAEDLRAHIKDITEFWRNHKRDCRQVILVTHSMGGLVARACARKVPEQILGVIHGAMPALGAPACYRRIACGTERWSPTNHGLANKTAEAVSDILGDRPAATMPAMANSPGALQLLPNHLYPQPWLHVCLVSKVNNKDVARDVVHLPVGNPYDMYRDFVSWYRLVDPKLADPAQTQRGDLQKVERNVKAAIDEAEHFHRETLGDYYHPNTYAFYGADPEHMSFGAVRWVARDPGAGAVFTEANLRGAVPVNYSEKGGRRVRVEGRTDLQFVPARQDVAGDGTVSHQSGVGPRGKVKQLFDIRGFDHQGAFQHDAVLLLTHHLIVKLVQKMP